MWDNLKFWLSVMLLCTIFGVSGYWVFSKLDSGSEHVSKQKLSDLAEENKDLRREIKKLEQKLSVYETNLEQEKSRESEVSSEDKVVIETMPTQSATTTSVSNSKYTKLISELEALIKDNISMKLKSRGTRVGTIQNFLNIYNSTSNKVDNDYGEGTKKAVASFQKAMGLTADGEAGTETFVKMVEWLKKQ